MKSGKRHLMVGIELPNQDDIKTIKEKETYKYWASWKLTQTSGDERKY